MPDPRYAKLADLLINYSTRLKKGEHILIEAFDIPQAMVIELVKSARRAGGHPHVAIRDQRVMRALIEDAGEDNLKAWTAYDLARMEKMQCYLGLRGSENVSEMAGVDEAQMKKWARLYQKPVHFERRINHTRWCVLRWPTPSMAQLAQKSTEEFENFYFDVCTMDYARMDAAADKLKQRMEKTDKVHLKGPGETDLTFSIKGIPVKPCTGAHNIPDGECFTAPVRESINGLIQFNTPTLYNGISFENVRLEFKSGKIIAHDATMNADKLGPIFDTDDGARYTGEFAIGFHPYILEPMKDILFDEKIAGSIHLTPGRCYDDASNGNTSEIHWDLVLIQRPEYGGGTMEFDGEVVRRDGRFVVEELEALNPEQLKQGR